MLNFVCGSAGSGKSEYLYNKVAEDIKNGVSSYILVPEQYSMSQEDELLKKLGFQAQRYASVITFSRLSNMVMSKLGPLRMKYIDGAGKNMLALRSLRVLEKELKVFGKNVHQKGFSSILVSIFSEFKRYGVTEEALSAIIEKCEKKELSDKLSDLKILYLKYNELLNKKNADAEDNLSLIIPKLSECDFLKGKLYINHFKSFTPLEYEAISALLKKMDVTVFFVSDSLKSKNQVFKSVTSSYKKLNDMAESLGKKRGEDVFLSEDKKFSGNKELLFLKENYISLCPKTYGDNVENIKILRPRTYYDECTETARVILKLMRERGYVQDDFLVLLSNGENYEDILPIIFDKNGLGCFIDKKSVFCQKPFVRFVLSILEILVYGFSYERIMTYLRSGFFPVSKREADLFENYLLAAAPSYALLFSKNDFMFNPDEDKFDMEEINRAKNKILNPVIDLSKAVKGRKTAEQICEAFYEWLNKNNIKVLYEEKIEVLKNGGETAKAREEEAVWNTFLTVFAQIEETFSDTFLTYQEFYELFFSAISDIKLGKTPSYKNKITVSETKNFRSTDKKVVIVLGVSEGEFPKVASGDGLITDGEREYLKEGGLQLAETALEKLYDEQFLVYSVLTAPRDMLVLSSPVANMEGGEIAKSEVVLSILKIFPKIREEYPDNEKEAQEELFLEGREMAFEELQSKLFGVSGKVDALPDLWRGIYEYFSGLPQYREKLEKIDVMIARTEKDEDISKEIAELLYGKPLMMSVSKLEKYNGCAFSYFLRYGLYAEERKKAKLMSNDVGSLLHDALYTYFFVKNKENADYKNISRQDVKRDISKIIEESASVKENALYENSAYYKYTVSRLKDIASVTAWKIVKFYAQSSFRPYGFEIKIGKGGAFPPYTIKLTEGEANLTGYIDRMDVSEIDGKKYFSIIDYKSSEKTVDKYLAEKGVRIQPLLYAGIIKENLENSSPCAMLYMKMADPFIEYDGKKDDEGHEKMILDEVKTAGLLLDDETITKNLDAEFGVKGALHFVPNSSGSQVSEAEMDLMLDDAIKVAMETSQKISDGEIEINPLYINGKFDPCQYCEYASVCEKPLE